MLLDLTSVRTTEPGIVQKLQLLIAVNGSKF